MTILRSETMQYFKIVFPYSGAYQVLGKLGQLGKLHFVDRNPSLLTHQKPFSNQIKKCLDLEEQIDQIEKVMAQFKLSITRERDLEAFFQKLEKRMRNRGGNQESNLSELDNIIQENTTKIDQLQTNYNSLADKLDLALEEYTFTKIIRDHLGDKLQHISHMINVTTGEETRNIGQSMQLAYITGVIDTCNIIKLERSIYRITRDKSLPSNIAFPESAMEELRRRNPQKYDTNKTALFIVFPVSSSESLLSRRLVTLCTAFGAKLIKVPNSPQQIEESLEQYDSEIKEFQGLLRRTSETLVSRLEILSQIERGTKCSYLEYLRLSIIKEKAVYNTLNFIRRQRSLLIGSFWAPSNSSNSILRSMEELQEVDPDFQGVSITPITHTKTPPTYFELNDFTEPFQDIVNTYSVPRYKEINPALVTSVTFPFQFGVMFGDVAHGACIVFLAIYIFAKQKQLNESSLGKKIVSLRFLFMMMGFFSVYCGIIYNDFMSVKLTIFGSCYNGESDGSKSTFTRSADCTYPVGFDWVWGKTSNELVFSNSFKMKLSIIIGVIHMTLGILFKGVNNIADRDFITFIFEFIPQLLFFMATFGYMVVLIILKWLTNWEGGNPPSIINIFINLFSTPTSPLYGNVDGSTQASVQLILGLVALICVPIMLCVKPILLFAKSRMYKKVKMATLDGKNFFDPATPKPKREQYFEMQERSNPPSVHSVHSEQIEDMEEEEKHPNFEGSFDKEFHDESFSEENGGDHDGGHDDGSDFAETFIHQLIETIEYVLGSISNTASYLRLWALSLAHGQLANVFLTLLMGGSLTKPSGLISGIIGIVIGYFFLAIASFAVLLVMDQMECFLHALRLHWVEFQSKFFKGGGYSFNALSLVEESRKLDKADVQNGVRRLQQPPIDQFYI